MMEQTTPKYRVTVTDRETGTTKMEEVMATMLFGVDEDQEDGFMGMHAAYEMSGEQIVHLFEGVRRHYPDIRKLETFVTMQDRFAELLDKSRERKGVICDCEACTARRKRREANQ